MCAGVAWSRLYDGSEQDPDACGDPHGQRTPERDPYYAWHDTCYTRSRGQRTQKCQEKPSISFNYVPPALSRHAFRNEQRLCVFQVGGVEALGEPAVDRGEEATI